MRAALGTSRLAPLQSKAPDSHRTILQLIDGKPAIKTPEAIISRDKQAEEA